MHEPLHRIGGSPFVSYDSTAPRSSPDIGPGKVSRSAQLRSVPSNAPLQTSAPTGDGAGNLTGPNPDAAPHTTGTLHGYHNTGHPGLDQVKALAKHSRPDPTRVAELMAEHKHDAARISTFVTEQFGAGYGAQVDRAGKHAWAAFKLDLDMGTFNQNHQDEDGPNRLADGGTRALIAKPTHVYANNGTPFPVEKVPQAREVKINAGAYQRITLQDTGAQEDCVMAFSLGPTSADAKRASGWIPVSSLDPEGQRLAGIDKAIASQVQDQHKGIRFVPFAEAKTVTPASAPVEFANLRTVANQTSDDKNLPQHYYARPGSVADLYSNVPNTGGATRFGVAIDSLVANTKFLRADPLLRARTPLWKAGTKDLTNQVISFIYGRAELPQTAGAPPAKAPSFGWINEELIK